MYPYKYTTFLLLILLVSCKNETKFEETDNGLRYYFVEKHNNAKQPELGCGLVINIQVIWNDSVLFDTRKISSNYRIELKPKSNGTIYEGLAMMHVGDSAIFEIDAFNFYHISADFPTPTCLHKGDKITFYVKLLDFLTPEDIIKENKRINQKKLENEIFLLNDYIRANNISQKPIENGLYYIEQKKGTGKKPQFGDSVTIHYEAKLINNMTFDSSIKNNTPYSFIFTDSTNIKGFIQGIELMKQGGVATLIIPSSLAFGAKGAGKIIPPYSTIIFEIHLLKVKSNK